MDFVSLDDIDIKGLVFFFFVDFFSLTFLENFEKKKTITKREIEKNKRWMYIKIFDRVKWDVYLVVSIKFV